jgi:hypothetical protein
MAIVYQHIRKDTNEVFYIGIGKTIARSKTKKSRNDYWHHIVDKVGYNIEIIHDKITWEMACELEKFYIQKYGRKDLGLGPLVNMTNGGEGTIGQIISDEHKMKLSVAHKGKFISKEHKEKISTANKGKNPNKNHDEEWCKKHSERMKGQNNPFYQKKPSQEVLNMISGENCKTSKLKNDDVLYIRKMYIKSHPEFGSKPLSIKFGVQQRQITDIIRRKRWKHI